MGFLASTSHGGVELSANGGFHNWGTHIAGWFTFKTPIKVDDLGCPYFILFQVTPKSLHHSWPYERIATDHDE